jgi:hypothetical protein
LLADPLPTVPVLVDPVVVDPVFAVFAVFAPPGVVSAGLLLVLPGSAGVDGGDAGGGELVLAGAGEEALTLGPAVLDGGVAVVGGQGVPVALAGFLLPAALVVAFAEAAEVVLLVAVPVPVGVGVAVAVSLALALSLAWLPLAPLPVAPVGWLLTELVGGTVGVSDFSDLAGVAAVAADDGEADTHAGGSPLLLPAAEVPRGPAPPAAELAWVPVPFRLGLLPPGLEPENPAAVTSWWTKASRSGGIASATPMANTAQAAARAGRSSPYRQSRCCRRALPLPASWPLPASCPPRAAFQRRTRLARNPPCAAECLLA